MKKATLIDQIEVTRSGIIQVRMRKVLVNDDGSLDELGYHRTSIEPGVDTAKVFDAVNEHLARMKQGQVDESELKTLKAIVNLVHTKELVQSFRESALAHIGVKEG